MSRDDLETIRTVSFGLSLFLCGGDLLSSWAMGHALGIACDELGASALAN